MEAAKYTTKQQKKFARLWAAAGVTEDVVRAAEETCLKQRVCKYEGARLSQLRAQVNSDKAQFGKVEDGDTTELIRVYPAEGYQDVDPFVATVALIQVCVEEGYEPTDFIDRGTFRHFDFHEDGTRTQIGKGYFFARPELGFGGTRERIHFAPADLEAIFGLQETLAA